MSKVFKQGDHITWSPEGLFLKERYGDGPFEVVAVRDTPGLVGMQQLDLRLRDGAVCSFSEDWFVRV